jgi:hypothetical protein
MANKKSDAPKRPTKRKRWSPDPASVARLAAEWHKLDPEFREALRRRATRDGKYLVQVLEESR